MTDQNNKSLALVLSGGGVRAMIFHLGLLRVLAERNAFERIQSISTVSGGSLLVGLIFQEAKMQWPSSSQFLSVIYPTLRDKLCARSLQWGAARQLLNPLNLRFILSRANLLALALQKEWRITEKVSDLPALPEWSINGTTAETGKRFRFKFDSIGDYTLGYAAPNDVPLANALAVSAAFPGGFGPLTLDVSKFEWRKRSVWDAPADSALPNDIGFTRLRLYDGGVYDNLGLEPFFDAGRGISKIDNVAIIVSDAGAQLRSGFSTFALNPWRLKRVADIMSDQAHALRVRTFWNFLEKFPGSGSYVYIDAPDALPEKSEAAKFSANFPTTLLRTTKIDFDKIVQHGYQVSAESKTLKAIG